jgi:hypothetical protein
VKPRRTIVDRVQFLTRLAIHGKHGTLSERPSHTRAVARVAAVVTIVLGSLALAACGGSGSEGGPSIPTIVPAKVFSISGFSPSTPVKVGEPVNVSFTVTQPSGETLTAYRRGPGPHTGAHLIAVRDDLSLIIHHHPPVAADGKVRDVVTFPKPGTYHVLVDIYPDVIGAPRNLQLVETVHVSGAYRPEPTPAFKPAQTVDGYSFTVLGKPKLKAVEPGYLTIRIADPNGQPAKLSEYYGALAHAIFFREGTLDYFHTHVCAPGSTVCAGFTGLPTGTSTKPGVLQVGVLMPIGGVWRLFLQIKTGGRIVTAPYTLNVQA